MLCSLPLSAEVVLKEVSAPFKAVRRVEVVVVVGGFSEHKQRRLLCGGSGEEPDLESGTEIRIRMKPFRPSCFLPKLLSCTLFFFLLPVSSLSFHNVLRYPSLILPFLNPSFHPFPSPSLTLDTLARTYTAGGTYTRPVHILVATPGRLCELITDEEIPMFRDMSGIRFLIVDEADRIVEEGHFPEVRH